ncbi:hypothetical protein [Streptomyces sp. NPDC003554]
MSDSDELIPEKAVSSTMPSLLGVFAQPDDESLLAGGVLAQHTAAQERPSRSRLSAEGKPEWGQEQTSAIRGRTLASHAVRQGRWSTRH